MVSDYMAATFFPSSPSFLSHGIRQPKLKSVIYVNFYFYFYFFIFFSCKLFPNLLFNIKLI